MNFEIHGYRHGDFLFSSLGEYKTLWREICESISSVSDEDIIKEFQENNRKAKSISQAINRLLKRELTARGWNAESPIFAGSEYNDASRRGTWRLDFAKESISVEVAFNHRSDIAWNLIKPTLASQLNHVEKAIQTDGGVIICATEHLKRAGGFDSAIGTFDDYVAYLKPMGQILTSPLVIIGLEAPESFDIRTKQFTDSRTGSTKKVGYVHPIEYEASSF
jgi:hypothetical protein